MILPVTIYTHSQLWLATQEHYSVLSTLAHTYRITVEKLVSTSILNS